MAVISISEALLMTHLKEWLHLPNGVALLPQRDPRVIEFRTDLPGFDADEEAIPCYKRDLAGNVRLVRIDRRG
jgi:hypothetical protein